MIKKLVASLLLFVSIANAGLPPTTSKVSGDSTAVTTFGFQFPNFPGTHSGTQTTFTATPGITNYAAPGLGDSTTGWTARNWQQTFTVTSATPAVFTVGSTTGFYVGMPIAFTAATTMPTGLTSAQTYYVSVVVSGTTFKVSATLGGGDLATSSTGVGTLTSYPLVPINNTTVALSGLTFATSTSSPLAGTSSYTLTQTNSTKVAGQGEAFDFTIDSAYQGQKLGVSFLYNASSTFTASSGLQTSDSDIEVAIWDRTNSALVPLNTKVLTANGSNNYIYSGTFQVPSNSTSYSAILFTPTMNANATGWTLKFDNFAIGPPSVPTSAVSNYGLQPTIQKFTSGSGTYTTPNGVQYIRVRAVGGGGGGAGGSAGSGGTGGVTTFGTSLITANGGVGGTFNGDGGTGGTASLGTGPIGTAIQGGQGQGSNYGGGTGTMWPMGGCGAASPFGGAGGGASYGAVNGYSAIANTGSGGGGASGAQTTKGGSGGGAGGFVDAIITAPLSTYAYAIGSSGAGGVGTNTGGAGGTGYIEVTEYYYQSGGSGSTIVTDWAASAVTPSAGFGTVSNSVVYSRRLGDSLQVKGSWTNGTLAASAAFITIPYTIDTAKVNSTTQAVGLYQSLAGGTNFSPGSQAMGVIAVNSATPTQVYLSTAATTSAYTAIASSSGSLNTGAFNFDFTVPISGWSSGSATGNGNSPPTIKASYYLSANATPGVNTQINFDTKIYDAGYVTTGAGAWKFTAPISGTYTIKSVVNSSGSSYIQLWKNGVALQYVSLTGNGAGASVLPASVCDVQLLAGDYIDLRTVSSVSVSGQAAPYATKIDIIRSGDY